MGEIKYRVRKLRKNQTPSETFLWDYLRGRKLDKLKFRRQHPISIRNYEIGNFTYFIADFYCAELKLIIELDGEIHKYFSVEDRERKDILEVQGYKIIRFKNDELAGIKNVLKKILSVASDIRSQSDIDS